jgi:predicted O-linked N-acetylglucosamine transferase (SPINDLY family)
LAAREQARARAAWESGRSLRQAGQLQAARAQFQLATRWAPQDALYWLNLARSEQLMGLADEAMAHAEHAFALDRTSLAACNMLAEMKRDARHSAAVLQVLDQLDPGTERDALWHILRGTAVFAAHAFEAAAHCFITALSLAAGDLGLRRRALTQLGHCFGLMKRHHDGSHCYRMVLDMDPHALGSALYAAHYSAWACDWALLAEDMGRLSTCMQTVIAEPAEAAIEALSPFCLLNLSDDPHLLRWLAERACAHPTVTPAQIAPWQPTPVPRPDGRLRIGWISSDLHHHATSILLAEVLEHFDRDRVELVFYSGGPDDRSPMRQRVLATAAQVHEVAQWSADELAMQIRQDQIGVLIDLKGFTFGSRLNVLAQRPAPVQLAWLGYPGTCGAAFVDYIVGDPVVTPLDAQPHYSEHIAQLPHCYQPNDSTRSRPATLSRSDCGLPEGAFVFASFNQSYKILPEVFAAWCRILDATPGAVLWLLVPQADTQARLRSAAAAHGVALERLVFAPFVGTESHRARLPNADLFLDTFPCGGHTTASDALWAGVPVLTLTGQSFASRVAASLVTTVGLPEMACADLDDYVAQALHYAHDPAALAALRQRLEAGRVQSPLFDGRRFARDFQHLLLRMVERQDAGLPPAPLAAQTHTGTQTPLENTP